MFQLSTILTSLSIFLISVPSLFGQPLEERQLNYGTATYFTPGLGACGVYSGPDDWIIAISADIYDSGANCGRTITITNEASSASVSGMVLDKCPSCDPNHLDLGQVLFEQIGDPNLGVLYVTWQFDD